MSKNKNKNKPSWFKHSPRKPDLHDLGWWVETREDALKETFYLKFWYGNDDAAWKILVELARDIDAEKEEDYVDRNYAENDDDSGGGDWFEAGDTLQDG